MSRKKVRVPEGLMFDRAVEQARQGGRVLLENEKRRYFVVESLDDSELEALRLQGCKVADDYEYTAN